MDDLSSVRQEIDRIDDEMLRLFRERTECANKVAAYKAQHKMPVLDRTRERAIVLDAADKVPDDMRTYAEVLMELLMSASRSRQTRLLSQSDPIMERVQAALAGTPALFPTEAHVACQGVEGAYSQMACDRLFKHAEISFFDTFEGVFAAVEQGFCDFGVLPVENSTAGSVNQVYDLMMEHNFSVARTCRLKVDHCLLAKPGVGLDDITDVYSHEQAINQCQGFLSQLHGATVHVARNTAMASKMVAESERPGVAALASRSAAQLYGLEVLARDIQDRGNNYTRFACISKDLRIYPGADRTSLMLVVNHEPGALYHVLSKFYALDLNVTKLESRPIPDRDFEFMFYFDADIPAASPDFGSLITGLRDSCEDLRYLGSYVEVV